MVALRVPAGSVGTRQGAAFFRQQVYPSRMARSANPPRSKRSRISSTVTPTRLGRGMEDRHEADLLTHLGKLLRGERSLAAFRQWFANALWDREWSDDDDTLDFAYLVENRLAEYSGEHVSEDQLLHALRDDVVAHLRSGSVAPVTGATAVGVGVAWGDSLSMADASSSVTRSFRWTMATASGPVMPTVPQSAQGLGQPALQVYVRL